MAAILPSIDIDDDSILAEYFMPWQAAWILAEDPFHAQRKQVFALAEKSVQVGFTTADIFKNIRKRLRFKKRDYLFATKDYPSSLEYMRLAKDGAHVFRLGRSLLSHGEDYLKVPRLDADGKPTGFTDEIKMGYIRFDNGSRIIAFSSHPQAMAVYAGDVGLDEFAKHPNAELLWQTAQGRVTWAFDLAVWSSHQGDNTLFNRFAQQARLACTVRTPAGLIVPASAVQTSTPESASTISVPPASSPDSIQKSENSSPGSDSQIKIQNSKFKNELSPWNLYFRITITDAIEAGLVETINRTRGSNLTRDEFLAGCKARAGLEEIFQQTYMCNPLPGGASIVDWSAIERCRHDYTIERLHLEADQVTKLFGEINSHNNDARTGEIHKFLRRSFPILFNNVPLSSAHSDSDQSKIKIQNSKIDAARLGFDIAASGDGDLAAFYIDEPRGPELWLRALLTVRSEDWHFLKTVLHYFLRELKNVRGAGDESGLGRQICWEAAQQFPSRFQAVNFSSKKHDLGFSLMNQLSVAEKRFPKNEHDIAADFFALRKVHTGNKWIFTEGPNNLNPYSHCDIAWAGALSSYAHTTKKSTAYAMLG